MNSVLIVSMSIIALLRIPAIFLRIITFVFSSHCVRRWRSVLYMSCGVLFYFLFSTVSYAALDLNGQNRFIFKASNQRLAIGIKNRSAHIVLIQSTLRWGDGSEAVLPLALSKPMQVLNPDEQADIEVFYQGEGLPVDRESYFLLSVLDLVQAAPEPDTVHIALVHHFKLFFRPTLEQSPQQAIDSVLWKQAGQEAVSIENPSPYFITLSEIQWQGVDRKLCGSLIDHTMIAPFSTVLLPSADCATVAGAQYDVVGDGGDMRGYRVDFTADAAALGRAQ